MYSLVSVPYYDHHTQCYKKVIKLNKMPPVDSPLNAIIKNVGPIKLSPFQTDSSFSGCNSGGGCGCGCGCGCGNISHSCNILITKINDKHDLLCVDELPLLFEFLLTNGFTINTSITKMMQNSNVKLSNDLLCFFS
jgi:hypothetical protein